MSGPQAQDEALRWIQDALPAGRYIPSVHLRDRLNERKLDMEDVFVAVEKAVGCATYTKGVPVHGGTCWRITGPDASEDKIIAVGIEAFIDRKGRRCVICTVFRPDEV